MWTAHLTIRMSRSEWLSRIVFAGGPSTSAEKAKEETRQPRRLHREAEAHLRAGFLSDPSYESLYGGSATWRWLRPVLPLHPSPVSRASLHRIGLGSRRRGVTHGNLRSLKRASSSPVIISSPKMALLNARSLVNKTFFIKRLQLISQFGFYVHHGILAKVGDLTPLLI